MHTHVPTGSLVASMAVGSWERMQRAASLLREVQGQCREANAEMERRRGGRTAEARRSRSASADGRDGEGSASDAGSAH